jgi:hypothetical protein
MLTPIFLSNRLTRGFAAREGLNTLKRIQAEEADEAARDAKNQTEASDGLET